MIFQIDDHYQLSDKVQLKDSIALRPRAHCDGKTHKCSRYLELSSFEVNDPIALNLSDNISRSVFNWRGRFGETSLADLKTRGWNLQAQSFMRPVMVIFKTPVIKFLLDLIDSPRERFAQQFGFQRPVKSFIFSNCLWMNWCTVANQNTKPHQPNRQCGKWISSLISPRWTVITNNLVRQTILPKCITQVRLHRLCALIQTRFQNHRVSRVIIQNRQWVAPSFGTSNMSFKIHLPQIVGVGPFKSLESPFRTFKFIDKSFSSENFGNRTRCWNIVNTTVLKKPSNFSATPSRMPFAY